MEWRSGKGSRPLDEPFVPPPDREYDNDEADDESTDHRQVEHRDSTIDQALPGTSDELNPIPQYSSPPSRPSIDAYGAFSDPLPTGYSNPNAYAPPESNRMSRTMQYADPYAAVQASVHQSIPPPGYGNGY